MNILLLTSVYDKFFIELIDYLDKNLDVSKFYVISETDFSEKNNLKIEFLFNIREVYNIQSPCDYDYLETIEEKFQLRFSEMLTMERHFKALSKNHSYSFCQNISQRIIPLFEESKVDYVFSSGLADFTSFFLRQISLKYRKPFRYLIPTRIGNRLQLSESTNTEPIKKQIDFVTNPKPYIKNYLQSKKQPDYLKDPSMGLHLISRSDVSVVLKILRRINWKSFTFLWRIVVSRIRRFYVMSKYSKLLVDYDSILHGNINDGYFVYPLHFHPEASTLVQGRWFNNQLEIINLVSKHLSARDVLLVKEHPVSLGRRSVQFYRAIDALTNVQIIPHDTPVYDLIERSLGVITISSTMGLETLMLGKPVLVWGDIWYSELSNAIMVERLDLIADYLDEMKSKTSGISQSDEEILANLIGNSIEVEGFRPYAFSENHIRLIGNMLARDIHSLSQKSRRV